MAIAACHLSLECGSTARASPTPHRHTASCLSADSAAAAVTLTAHPSPASLGTVLFSSAGWCISVLVGEFAETSDFCE